MSLLPIPALIVNTAAVVVAAGDNPFDGVTPNFDWLGDGFNRVWVPALGGALGLALIALAFFFIRAVFGLRKALDAKKPNDAEHARNTMLGTGIAIACVILTPTLFLAITTAAQRGA
ncbi:hypothetical protein LQK89_16885 (plasmid) [Curtobacterium sp. C1]|jgi:hypothetical protein|uniref:hypothetical protein n=1 Tax=unclassified Curtobacterium TaxID=257496 RepID=UPI0011B815CC|nr:MULTISPECIES: hypothetical protein [unclassified Curtobacterium]UFU15953.1 hypothetical protein LQK89_16885 [Curtobacterium sp. C1]WIB62136.1 hypothetical protein DEJ13_17850 [Curtobacterium sp. MCLR17_007]